MSEIKVDTLTGKTSAGDITVTSEGGAATQSLQQGLAKCWINFDATSSNAIRDSLSIGSITDSGTGVFSLNLSSAMANDDYVMSGCSLYSGASGFDDAAVISRDNTQVGSVSTTVNPFYTFRLQGNVQIRDCPETMILLHGDLA